MNDLTHAQGTRFEVLVMRKFRRAQRGVFFGPFELMYLRRGAPSVCVCVE